MYVSESVKPWSNGPTAIHSYNYEAPDFTESRHESRHVWTTTGEDGLRLTSHRYHMIIMIADRFHHKLKECNHRLPRTHPGSKTPWPTQNRVNLAKEERE